MTFRAVLFDYGGTLDGAGSHWLVRFARLYAEAGIAVPFERVRAAFDHATHCGYTEPGVDRLGLQALVEFHVGRQMEHLGIEDPNAARFIVAEFVSASRAAMEESRLVLERLRPRVALGVVSNFYGNVDRVLAEAGIAALLATIIDSRRVGVSKPDPAIFALALEQLRCDPLDALYVGDSFEKDVMGAHAAGMRAAWLVGADECACPAPDLVHARVRSLADLEAIIA